MMHVALQGCLRARDVEYGLTADTGGHIRYLLELAAALEASGVDRQEIIVRRFDDPDLGSCYAAPAERISDGVSIIRIEGATSRYLRKEELWQEHGAMANALEAHIRTLDVRPDIIQGHYADGGWLAAEMKHRLGIPFVFTGHSLGRSKQQALSPQASDADLERRIEIEEYVLAHADRVIASSRDEAELQYRLYKNAHNERIRVNPPGCDLAAFQPADLIDPELVQEINRYLTRPELPPILALARPVRKKNLAGLVTAYGESPELRERANLVIFAGSRHDIREEEDEHREVISELLYLIDRYDLWGKVAIPKRHAAHQVPHIYRYAAALRGVLVNPAFNEPFGLTLLEAAASGLPVVATDRGGPNDILSVCQHGLLVDPSVPARTADAVARVVFDDDAWARFAENGRKGAGFYAWQRHVREYLEELNTIMRPPAPALVAGARFSHLLVSDIDNTLVGCDRSLKAFGVWRESASKFCFAIATGRSLHGAIDILRREKAPVPTVLVTSVGSEIYFANDGNLRDLVADREWSHHIGEDWKPACIALLLEDLANIDPQPAIEQGPFKLSYFVPSEADARGVETLLREAGIPATVIFSHGRFLDILPARASKGHALAYLAQRFGIDMASTFAAGDSGNDVHMLRRAATGIVVANHTPELRLLQGEPNAYFAKQRFAAGILEGISARHQVAS